MKTLARISLLFLLYLILAGCWEDQINPPYKKTVDTASTALCPPPAFSPTATHKRKVLLEDYTGHRCGNCPNAARTAAALEQTYKEQLIVVAIHAGGLAVPDLGMPDDFRTDAGNKFNNDFLITTWPSGLINRAGFPANHIRVQSEWAGAVSSILTNDPDMDIKIINDYNSNTKLLCMHVYAQYLKNFNDTLKLSLFLTEDSIISPQVDDGDSTLPLDKINPDYVHMHMLRAALNGIYGDVILTGAGAKNDTLVKNYAFDLSKYPNWVVKNLHVVAFIHKQSNYEVIQADEEKVIQ